MRGVAYDYADQNALMGGGLDGWLATNERILRGAKRLVAPSRDTAERYARRLGLSGIAVVPHPEAAPPAPVRPRRAPLGPVRVALVGGIGHHKGFELVVALAERAARERRPIAFTVIGNVADDKRVADLANLTVTGAYDPEDLPRLLDEADPDYVFLSSVWPETYSYVLSEVWSAGYRSSPSTSAPRRSGSGPRAAGSCCPSPATRRSCSTPWWRPAASWRRSRSRTCRDGAEPGAV